MYVVLMMFGWFEQVTVHLVSANKDTLSVFKVKHVDVKVDTLKET